MLLLLPSVLSRQPFPAEGAVVTSAAVPSLCDLVVDVPLKPKTPSKEPAAAVVRTLGRQEPCPPIAAESRGEASTIINELFHELNRHAPTVIQQRTTSFRDFSSSNSAPQTPSFACQPCPFTSTGSKPGVGRCRWDGISQLPTARRPR